METYTREQLSRMREALHEIADNSKNVLQRAERSVLHISGCLSELRTFISKYKFRDETEEIIFFKEVKPQYLEPLYYYRELFQLESARPLGMDELILSYYEKRLTAVNSFFERNHSLYIYYKTGRTDKDNEFFTRNASVSLTEVAGADIDPVFSTAASNVVAGVLGFERLCEYISATIKKIHQGESSGTTIHDVALQWTDTKAGLIELLYGLHEKGCFNNGKSDLKQVVQLFEVACKVDLGNYSRTFQEIRIRKKNKTVFLDNIKEMFEQRMEKADGF